MEPLVAYLHYLSIILTGGFLVGELVVCRPGITADQARRLASIDVVFFVSALVALATGLLRLFFYAKGVGFYTDNPAFWTKMALYVIIAVLSIKPTRTFLRWKRAASGSSRRATRSPGLDASSTSSSACWRSCRCWRC